MKKVGNEELVDFGDILRVEEHIDESNIKIKYCITILACRLFPQLMLVDLSNSEILFKPEIPIFYSKTQTLDDLTEEDLNISVNYINRKINDINDHYVKVRYLDVREEIFEILKTK